MKAEMNLLMYMFCKFKHVYSIIKLLIYKKKKAKNKIQKSNFISYICVYILSKKNKNNN